MAQQIFNQWVPVAKAQNEQGQEVYLPFAGIHAQTRDGKDEIIVGAGNMVWSGSMWVPVDQNNPLEVRARALEALLQTLGKEEKTFYLRTGEEFVPGNGTYPESPWEFNFPVEIESLIWVTNARNSVALNIELKMGESWVSITDYPRRSTSGGSETLKLTHRNVVDYNIPGWDVIRYDTDDSDYCLSLRRPIRAPEGIRLWFENMSGNIWRIQIVAYGRRL